MQRLRTRRSTARSPSPTELRSSASERSITSRPRPTGGSESPPTRRSAPPARRPPLGQTHQFVLDAPARPETHRPRRRFAEQRRRPPKALDRRTRRRDVDARRRNRSRSSIRPASRQVRLPRSRAPTGSARCDAPSIKMRCSARSRARSSTGGMPRTRPCIIFRYSLPPSSSRAVAENHDCVAGRAKRPSHDRLRVLDQPDDAEHRRRIYRRDRRFRCRG